jgi:hypothetical protein
VRSDISFLDDVAISRFIVATHAEDALRSGIVSARSHRFCSRLFFHESGTLCASRPIVGPASLRLTAAAKC